MSVSVRIPTILRTYTGGESEVTAEGGTLAEVLDDLDARFSGIKARILDDQGAAVPGANMRSLSQLIECNR